MDDAAQDELRHLLLNCRVLSLAVVADAAPYAALLPFAPRSDLSGLLVHVSDLARHTRGLGEGASFGAVIARPDDGGADPLQLPRVMLQGRVRRLEQESEAWAGARREYVARFPDSARIFGLGDFHLCELVPESGRLVTGFAGAHNIGPKTLARLAGAS